MSHFLRRNMEFSFLEKRQKDTSILYSFPFRHLVPCPNMEAVMTLTAPFLPDCLSACECWSPEAHPPEVAGTSSSARPRTAAGPQAGGAAPPSTRTAPRDSPGWWARRSPPSQPAVCQDPGSLARSLTRTHPSLEPAWSGRVSGWQKKKKSGFANNPIFNYSNQCKDSLSSELWPVQTPRACHIASLLPLTTPLSAGVKTGEAGHCPADASSGNWKIQENTG